MLVMIMAHFITYNIKKKFKPMLANGRYSVTPRKEGNTSRDE